MDLQRHEPIGGLGRGENYDWVVVQTEGGKEGVALAAAHARGFRCYLPRQVMWERINGKRRWHSVLKALFPGYLFIGFDSGTRKWLELWHMSGVIKVLGDKQQPYLIKYKVLADLAGCEDERAGQFKRDPRECWPFKVGDTVRVVDGAFIGFYGKLISCDKEERIALLLDKAFGRATPCRGLTVNQIRAA
jgi:transcription antitermination factor NusG